MTDQTGAAPAAAEPALAPINEAPATHSNPIESSGPEKAPEPVVEKPSTSVREAIAKADAKLKDAPKDAPKPVEGKPEAKVEVKTEPKARGEDGKFAAKEPQPGTEVKSAPPTATTKPAAEPVRPSHTAEDAPARFADTAKAKWHAADPEIRGEVLRMEREFRQGFEKYKAGAERDASLNEYHDLAAKHGTTVNKALEQYISLERKLTSQNLTDKQAGIEHVFQYAGINPREWAAQLLNQSPDQVQSQNDSTIRELRQQISQLQQQIGGVTQTFQQQREQSTLDEINKFASAPEHSRFEELADDIAFFMKSGRAKDLSDAYDLAERLNPALGKAAAQTPVIPAATAEAHTRGTKSISGSPSPGSSPAAKKGPSPSIRKALESAMARAS